MDLQAVTRPRGRANATSEGSESIDASTETTKEPTSLKVPGYMAQELDAEGTIVFINHIHDRYIWPYALARFYEVCNLASLGRTHLTLSQSAKGLIEEAYAAERFDSQRNVVVKGEYQILTEDGAIILPSVWDSIIRPSATIKISFEEAILQHNEGYDDRTDSPVSRPVQVRFSDVEAIDTAEGAEESEVELDSTTSDGYDGEPEVAVKPPEPPRAVILATDSNGDKLTHSINTHGYGPGASPSNVGRPDSHVDSKSSPERFTETLRITKALAVPSESDNKTVIRVSTLPGPKTFPLHDGVTMTWYHLHAKDLDFDRFRQACLGSPQLSPRLQILVRDLFAKIEKRKVKPFLDGLYVEPGTVLRVDESCGTDPQSVIFSCVPYLDLQEPVVTKSTERRYPPRTLMQSAYAYESVRERDAEQAYRKYGNTRSKRLIYVPSLWMMNIGVDVVVTCGHRPLGESSIRCLPDTL